MISKKDILSLVVQFLVIMFFGIDFFYEAKPKIKPYLFEEKFDSLICSFQSSEVFTHIQEIKNDKVRIINNDENSWAKIKSQSLDFPKNYTITSTSSIKSESYANYGITLFVDSLNSVSFYINPYSATIRTTTNGKESNKYGHFYSEDFNSIQQTIKIRGNNYSYYLNKKLVKQDTLPNFLFEKVGFQVSGFNLVEVENMSVKNDDTGEFLIKENFTFSNQTQMNEIIEKWNIKSQLKYNFENKEGKFLINHQEKNTCHEVQAVLLPRLKAPHWTFSADIKWLESDTSTSEEMGISFVRDKDKYTEAQAEFRINQKGEAFFKLFNTSKLCFVSTVVKTNINIEKNKIYNLKIEYVDEIKLVFYINEKKVMQEPFYYSSIDKIGILSCGRQITEVDNVKYEEN